MRTWFFALAMSAVAGLPGPVSAQWLTDGIRVSTSEATQKEAVLVPDPSGGAIVVWLDARNGGTEVYAQRVSASGEREWDPAGIPVATGPGVRGFVRAVSDSSGGAYVAWVNLGYLQASVRGTRLAADGSIVAGWAAGGVELDPPRPYPYMSVVELDLVGDPTGGALLVVSAIDGSCYVGGCYGWPRFAYANRLTPEGGLAWPAGIEVATEQYENIRLDAVSTAPGSFEIAISKETYPWLDRTHLDASGSVLVRPTIPLVLYGFRGVAAVPDAAGGMFVLWQRFVPTAHLLHFDGGGALVPGWPDTGLVLPGEQNSLAADEAGGAFVATITAAETHLRRLTAAGGTSPGWPAGGVPLANARLHSVAGDGTGGAFLAGTLASDPIAGDLVAYHVLGSSVPDPVWPAGGVAVCSVPAAKSRPALLHQGYALYLAWDRTSGPDPFDEPSRRVYLQRIEPDWPTPVRVSLAGTEADATHARIRWSMAHASGAFVIERNHAGRWVEMATLAADDQGRIAWDDREVAPGERYGYRLRVPGSATPLAGSEAWIEIPAASLSIRFLGRNSVAGAPEFSVSIPRTGSAAIDIVDVAGRRVADVVAGPFAAGVHRVRLERTLATGMWFARLRQGNESVTTRFALFR